MPPSTDSPDVFILRLWCEQRELAGELPLWRGMIEHVPSRKRLYVSSLDEILFFIVAYLEAMGVAKDSLTVARTFFERE